MTFRNDETALKIVVAQFVDVVAVAPCSSCCD